MKSKQSFIFISYILATLILLPLLAGCNASGIEPGVPTPVVEPTATVASDANPLPTETSQDVPTTETVEASLPTEVPTEAEPTAVASKPTRTARPAQSPAIQLGAYFVEWGVYQRDYVPADIPADLVNTIYYAFVSPSDVEGDGLYECAVYDGQAAIDEPIKRLVPGTSKAAGENLGMINQLAVLKRVHPELRIMMSVGGAGDSDNFPRISSNSDQRKHFAESCVEFMKNAGFDGIDIDWEFPAPADRDDYTALLQSFRDALDNYGTQTGQSYPLSIAAPAYEESIAAIDVAGIAPIISWANIMTYEFYGAWDSITGHAAPLCPAVGDPHGENYNASGGVLQWLAKGMPREKINLGLPYYGSAFQHLQDEGPNKAVPGRFAAVTPDDYVYGTGDKDQGLTPSSSFDYWDIVEKFTGPFKASTKPISGINGYTRYWDDEQGVPYVANPDAYKQTGDGLWLSYDDPQSLARKVQYARTLGLGGVFVWELSQERKPGTNDHPLTKAITAAINAPLDPVSCEPER